MKSGTAKVQCILAIDPGKKKCGLAVVSANQGILHREVVPCEDFTPVFQKLFRQHRPQKVLLGGSTGSKEIAEAIQESTDVDLKLVDERHTTEMAKVRYFQEFPPRGLWKLVPIGLQTPPTCYDDFAAVVLAERYLEEQTDG
ncbi:MAG TPA: Holliday junction resolvase RuvX [Phycisphaerales bacterium]|nr:Holliday junction resolvase RuvX [Phycisphaerales bacterium]